MEPTLIDAIHKEGMKERPLINPLLQKERDSASFDHNELLALLAGGADKLARRRELNKVVLSDPVVQKAYKEKNVVGGAQLYENSLRQGLFLADFMTKNNLNQEDSDYVLETLLDCDVAYLIHYLMFLPALSGLGTKEQADKWVGPTKRSEVIGTYAQTELGHGSSLKTIQTTAEYDKETDEFVLNTPLPTGMKWWPGGLAQTCNHAIVMAQLILNGKMYGLQPFIVQLRSLVDHLPRPGCRMGDIGNKMNRHTFDNGYLILKNVRIPRQNMLMKNNEVTSEGTFIKKGADKSSYGVMVRVRSVLIRWTALWTAKAAVIATRYSAVRVQGELKPGQPPVQILDYLTQQQKVFPCIAQAYAFKFAEWRMIQTFEDGMRKIEEGDLSVLPQLHATSAGLKAYCTESAAIGIERCRRALGGQGFALASGLPELYTTAVASVTYEGEATLMYTQTSRFLMKEMERSLKGAHLLGELSYLNGIPHGPANLNSIMNQDFSPFIKAFNTRSYFLLNEAAVDIRKSMKGGLSFQDAWNIYGPGMIQATKAHLEGCVAINFWQNIVSFKLSTEGRRVLSDLCILHALSKMLENSGEFLIAKALDDTQVKFLKEYEPILLKKLRPEVVSLVDVFDLPDEALFTAVGNYDGWVYDRLTEHLKTHKNNEVNAAIKKFYLSRRETSKL